MKLNLLGFGTFGVGVLLVLGAAHAQISGPSDTSVGEAPAIHATVLVPAGRWEPVFLNKSGAIARIALVNHSGAIIDLMSKSDVAGVECLNLSSDRLTRNGSTAIYSIDNACNVFAKASFRGARVDLMIIKFLEKGG